LAEEFPAGLTAENIRILRKEFERELVDLNSASETFTASASLTDWPRIRAHAKQIVILKCPLPSEIEHGPNPL